MHRPKSVPETAAWSGGADGGSYIDCYYNKERDYDDCTTYNDWTGDVIVSGHFMLQGQNRGAKPSELGYAFFDGDVIGLSPSDKSGKHLVLIRTDK